MPDYKARLLVIDDEPSVLAAVKLLLQALGYEAHAYSDARSAIEKVRNGLEIDLVVCDLRMPDMNGLETAREIKALRPELPFLLMSAHALQGDFEKAKASGVDGFLPKPFEPAQLEDKISLLVNSGRPNPSSA